MDTTDKPSMVSRLGILLALIVVLGVLAAGGFMLYHRSAEIQLPKDQYFAVFLTGGQLYFGRLTGLGTSYPVLTNVFYVQSMQDKEKQVQNILVKRGKEWHGPDRMYLNAAQIILVEPVGAGSRVAQLISEANR